VHPWVLPFDLPLPEARTYLEQLGTDRLQLRRAVRKEADFAAGETVHQAVDALGLSVLEADIITAGPLAAAHQPWEYWGLAETGNTVRDPVETTKTFTGTWMEVRAGACDLAVRQIPAANDSFDRGERLLRDSQHKEATMNNGATGNAVTHPITPARIKAAGMAGDLYGSPDGRPLLVLLNGLTYARGTWQPVLGHLGRIDPGRQVLNLDLPGQGDSPDQLPHAAGPSVTRN
jgi:hypothetical protein